ncbi:hypothetical protein, partial [Alistipes putredinis]|uniref:hypothetical protein n=2 Tax=Alistipes putredinis TaxID=28117 RepID=UPI003A86B561
EFIFALTGPSEGVFRGGFVGKKRLGKRNIFHILISLSFGGEVLAGMLSGCGEFVRVFWAGSKSTY